MDIVAQSSHKDLWRSLIVLYFHLECFVFGNNYKSYVSVILLLSYCDNSVTSQPLKPWM